jgi:uncharacterized membrane protein YoaK (UPF0700 family)
MHIAHIAGKKRNARLNMQLGCVLAFVAGAINAGGFFIVQHYTSHMTGMVSMAADSIALHDYTHAAAVLLYIVCFIFGSIVTTLMVLMARQYHLHAQYALTLLLEAMILVMMSLVWYRMDASVTLHIPNVIALLCFIMGLQNALITKASSAIIRTTHITGMSTDLGIEIGKYLFSKRVAERDASERNAHRHLSIIMMFFIGGIAGAYGVKYTHAFTYIPLAGILLVLAIPPLGRDIRAWMRIGKRVKSLSL